MNRVKRTLFMIDGFISLMLAGIGITITIVPIIPFPTVLFLLLASYCFANGSERFDK